MSKFHPLPNLNFQDRPEKVNYPYHFEPHPWAMVATKILQDYLTSDEEMLSYFDETNDISHVGKMFGVMIVENAQGKLGFLAGFSGKLGESNLHDYFVPPVFDILDPEYLFLNEVEEINEINRRIKQLEEDVELEDARQLIQANIQHIENELERTKKRLKENKKKRDEIRATYLQEAVDDSIQKKLEELNEISARENIDFKYEKRERLADIQKLKEKLEAINLEFKTLKEKRIFLSGQLQKKLFQEFKFLNANLEESDLYQLFNEVLGVNPPSGAGECAAPKMFQYAYLNQLKPLTFTEFWWGRSPKSEVRHHGVHYQSCLGKCKPILTHMLQGLEVEESPVIQFLKQKSEEIKELEIIYEDDSILLVNKPFGFLSVPGKEYEDSILHRLRLMLPNATGPILLHRLDMGTSGILLAAKDKETHFSLQQQFIKRRIKKRYEAVLDGIIDQKEGVINLPLRLDLNNRPRQIVDEKHGKAAETRYKVVSEKNNKTLIHFWPITGRTHQLRVHASHELGLNTPIIGDVLYGKPADRLYLHAAYISFYHPVLKKTVEFEVSSNFTL